MNDILKLTRDRPKDSASDAKDRRRMANGLRQLADSIEGNLTSIRPKGVYIVLEGETGHEALIVTLRGHTTRDRIRAAGWALANFAWKAKAGPVDQR